MERKQIIIDMNNPYVVALLKAFETFVLEECAGCISTEERLNQYIEFKQKTYQTFVKRETALSKIELSVCGKYQVYYLEHKW